MTLTANTQMILKVPSLSLQYALCA